MNHVAPITEAPTASAADPGDGVFFGLDEAVYHAIPRLSSSGIKNLLVSPMDFWARSWLNPRRKEDDDDADWKVYGRAYHKRILEGREAFYAAYASEIDPIDHPGCLTKQAHYKEECRRLCLPLGGTNEVLVARLLAAGCDKPLLHDLIEKNAAEHAGKEFLKADWFFQIEMSAACVEFDPALSPRFKGGFPEVSILWHDEVLTTDGEVIEVPMKARVDYMKPREFSDLKTLANQMQKVLHRAACQEIANRKYHIQIAVYYRAIEAAQEMVERGKVQVLSGPAPKHAWLDEFAKHPKLGSFVFQQKGVAPNAIGISLDDSRAVLTFGNARDQIREAQLAYVANLDHFGADPWIVSQGMKMADDTDFPAYMVQ